jgi:tetratricopeptide (TPR) repeat protein
MKRQPHHRGHLPTRARWSPAAIGLLAFAGCAELPDAAKQQKVEAEAAYRNQNYSAATNTLNALLDKYPDHPESAEAYYLRAMCYARQSNRLKALEDAQRAVRLSKQPELTAKAQVVVATMLYESGKTAAAIPHYVEALKALPEAPPADLVRYDYAVCLQREGQWGQAKSEFGVVAQCYPGSGLAENARRIAEWPDNFFSIQCGAFREKGEATKLVDKLRKAGLSPRMESRSRSGQSLFMVYVGQYPRYDQAQGALRAAQRQVSEASIAP